MNRYRVQLSVKASGSIVFTFYLCADKCDFDMLLAMLRLSTMDSFVINITDAPHEAGDVLKRLNKIQGDLDKLLLIRKN